MRLLVTGGAGFIGGHVVRRLGERGHSVVVLDDLSLGVKANVPAWAKLVVGDIRDDDALARAGAGCDAVVHLAAISSVGRCLLDPQGTGSVNFRGACAVAAWAGRQRARAVFSSSAAVYGDSDLLPVPESAPPRPLSPYAEQKAAAETAFLALPGASVLRFFNVYGPGQDPRSDYAGVISLFARRLGDGEPLIVYGDGGQTRDFVFVSDVARAVVQAVEREASEPLLANIATGTAVRIDALARAIGRVSGIPPDIRHEPAREGEIRASLAHVRVAREKLGFEARVSLEEGLTALLRPGAEEP